MERRINKKIENYITDFKENIKQKALELGMTREDKLSSIVQYICDYERLNLDKQDFMKRKRVKNIVSSCERCIAKRANGEQCTRRRKDEQSEYCGTHLKGTPHGNFDVDESSKQQIEKIDVWAENIKGIFYHIDKNGNVYQTEDILQRKMNPRVIACYEKKGDLYSIPAFNI